MLLHEDTFFQNRIFWCLLWKFYHFECFPKKSLEFRSRFVQIPLSMNQKPVSLFLCTVQWIYKFKEEIPLKREQGAGTSCHFFHECTLVYIFLGWPVIPSTVKEFLTNGLRFKAERKCGQQSPSLNTTLIISYTNKNIIVGMSYLQVSVLRGT